MDLIVNHIGGLASLIGSLTVVGGALLWLYNQFIGKPKERRREREQERLIKVITQENKPLQQSINQLNKYLDESKRDWEQLNETVKNHREKLNNHFETLNEHDDRLIVLETMNGVKKYRKEK